MKEPRGDLLNVKDGDPSDSGHPYHKVSKDPNPALEVSLIVTSFDLKGCIIEVNSHYPKLKVMCKLGS